MNTFCLYFRHMITIFAMMAPTFVLSSTDANLAVGHRHSIDPAEKLRQYDHKVRIGREIELTERPLSTIANYFDIKLEPFRDGLKEEDVRDYLLDEDAFRNLPIDLQRRLSEGLNLEKIKIIPGEVHLPVELRDGRRIVTPSLVDKNGKALSSDPNAPQILHPGYQSKQPSIDSIVLPKGVSPAPRTNRSWEILNERWNNLTLDEKARSVDLNYLSRLRRAKFIIENGGGPLTNEGSTQIKTYFANGADISRDQEALEFRDLEPYQKVYDFYLDLTGFAKRVGINGLVLDPDSTRRSDSSLHYHVSRINLREEDSLESLAKEFSRLITLRQLDKGYVDLLTDSNPVLRYRKNIRERGPVRLRSRDHFEIRVHFEELGTELEYVLRHTTANDLAVSLKEVKTDVIRLITPRVLQNLIGVDHDLDLAKDLVKDSKYLSILSELENRDELTVEKLFQRAYGAAEAMGLPRSLVDSPKSGMMNGIVRSPDAFSPMYVSLTMQVLARRLAVDSTIYKFASFLTHDQFQRIRNAQATIDYIQSLIDRGGKNRLLLLRAINIVRAFSIRNEDLFLSLIKTFPDFSDTEFHISVVSAIIESGGPTRPLVETAVKMLQHLELKYPLIRLLVSAMPQSDLSKKSVINLIRESDDETKALLLGEFQKVRLSDHQVNEVLLKTYSLQSEATKAMILTFLTGQWSLRKSQLRAVKEKILTEVASSSTENLRTQAFAAVRNLRNVDINLLFVLTNRLAQDSNSLGVSAFDSVAELWKVSGARSSPLISMALFKALYKSADAQKSKKLIELFLISTSALDSNLRKKLENLLKSQGDPRAEAIQLIGTPSLKEKSPKFKCEGIF